MSEKPITKILGVLWKKSYISLRLHVIFFLCLNKLHMENGTLCLTYCTAPLEFFFCLCVQIIRTKEWALGVNSQKEKIMRSRRKVNGKQKKRGKVKMASALILVLHTDETKKKFERQPKKKHKKSTKKKVVVPLCLSWQSNEGRIALFQFKMGSRLVKSKRMEKKGWYLRQNPLFFGENAFCLKSYVEVMELVVDLQ